MDLRHLEIFCRIVELKSFSKAAQELYLTQSTLSSHIKTLEDGLSIRLLDRLGREVVPTKAGEVLYEYARGICKLKADAKQAMDRFRGKIEGRLILGGSTIPGEYILPRLIGEFNALHPGAIITLRIRDSKEVMEMVLDGEVELGVVGSRPTEDKLNYKGFLKDELILVASSNHPLAKRDGIRPEGLRDIPLILREMGSGTRMVFEGRLKEKGVGLEGLKVVAEMGSTSAVKQGVKAGLGFTVISRMAVAEELKTGVLKEIPIKGLRLTRPFYIITHRLKAISPLCQAFLDYLSMPPR